MNLPQGNKIQAEYIFIGGSGLDLRSKSRVFPSPIQSLSDLPDWNYDGSSTKQATGHESEVLIKPIKYIPDPFRNGDNILVLCETYNPKTMEPLETNHRNYASKVFNNDKVKSQKPWFGLEQEYTFFDATNKRPYGWPEYGYPSPQGQYYCAIGGGNVFGRDIVESHYRACLYSGLEIGGINAEVMPSQWEYQIGAAEGIDAADQLWLARYILDRIAEEYNVKVSLDPKPMKGDWNGAGCHTNFSSLTMRNDGGFEEILKCMDKLKDKHLEHMKVYGSGNEERMTGLHETAKFNEFSYAIGSRGVSVRIQNVTKMNNKGFFEDRRPAANMDPYLVTAKLCETCILN
jgi:glutamine synthetase